jgi:hypothetical protein
MSRVTFIREKQTQNRVKTIETIDRGLIDQIIKANLDVFPFLNSEGWEQAFNYNNECSLNQYGNVYSYSDRGAIGDKLEQSLITNIGKQYPNTCKNYSIDKDKLAEYDIYLPELGLSIEAKNDTMTPKTGNIYIELGTNGRWSGFRLSTADIWVIAEPQSIMFIYYYMLNRCIHEQYDKYYKKACQVQIESRTYNQQALIVPKNIFTQYCFKVIKLTSAMS